MPKNVWIADYYVRPGTWIFKYYSGHTSNTVQTFHKFGTLIPTSTYVYLTEQPIVGKVKPCEGDQLAEPVWDQTWIRCEGEIDKMGRSVASLRSTWT